LEVAFRWLRDGIPKKDIAIRISDLTLRNTARNLKTNDEVETLLVELKRLGWVKGVIRKETEAAQDFITFLKTFWDWDTSEYIEEKLRRKHGIHKRHCKLQSQAIKLHWEDYFNGRILGEITAKEIDQFINHMAKKDLSADRKNVIIKAGFKPLRWAFSKGYIETDPTRGHLLFSGEETKRNILAPQN
jgi:hypothetical protein